MTDPTPDTPVEQTAATGRMNPTFVHAVGLLLLVIIAALTGLNVQYRRRAVAAELELRRVGEQLDRQNGILSTFLKLKPGQKVQIVTDGADEAATAADSE
jgi:hypothetical protein